LIRRAARASAASALVMLAALPVSAHAPVLARADAS
jgi:hypothetical protein